MTPTHLRRLASLLPMALVLAAPPARVQPTRALVGHWEGAGSFVDATLQSEAGSLPLVAEFSADGTGNGRFGKATLRDVRTGASQRYVEIRALLSEPVAAHRKLDKDRLVLVITRMDSVSADAEFHLKSNFLFDPTMREGKITLRRTR